MRKSRMFAAILFMAVLLLTAGNMQCVTEARTVCYGDVDKSGTLEAADALSVLKYVVCLQTFDIEQASLADMDGSGDVDAADALAILRTVVSLQDAVWYGEISEEEPTSTETVNLTGSTYVLNTSTKKFHYPGCWSADKIADKNRAGSDLSREELIAQGYSPCKNCNP